MTIMLFAKGIEFQEAKTDPNRTVPMSQNQILSYSSILKDSISSVVNIQVKLGYANNSDNQYLNPNAPKENAVGSGVILSSDGYIATNAHVIEDASSIIVTVPNDMNRYRAKLIGKDKASDLAVIKIDAKNLRPITIASTANLKVGDIVFAIGNPFGVGETVTQGIISALNKHSIGLYKYENFIQTDASINPGNSGGALVDSRGALIGINAAILSKSGGNHGVGFSIPSDMVKNVVSEIITKGKVERGFMGVGVAQIGPKEESFYTHKKGAIITSINPNSAAQNANLKVGDLIYKLNDKTISSPNALQQAVSALDPGNKITIQIERSKQNIAIDMTLYAKQTQKSKELDGGIVGMKLSYITPAYKRLLQIPDEVTGLIVTQIEVDSVADRFGFSPGDIIMQVGHNKIKTISQWYSTLRRGGVQEIFILRDGAIYLLSIRI